MSCFIRVAICSVLWISRTTTMAREITDKYLVFVGKKIFLSPVTASLHFRCYSSRARPVQHNKQQCRHTDIHAPIQWYESFILKMKLPGTIFRMSVLKDPLFKFFFSNLKMSVPGTKDSLWNGKLSKSRIQKWETERFIFILLLWVQMRALISHSDPNGQILGRVFGKTHFHQCGFNVSVAICLCRLIYSVETELSGELMRPSNGSWKHIRTSPVPAALPRDGCR